MLSLLKVSRMHIVQRLLGDKLLNETTSSGLSQTRFQLIYFYMHFFRSNFTFLTWKATKPSKTSLSLTAIALEKYHSNISPRETDKQMANTTQNAMVYSYSSICYGVQIVVPWLHIYILKLQEALSPRAQCSESKKIFSSDLDMSRILGRLILCFVKRRHFLRSYDTNNALLSHLVLTVKYDNKLNKFSINLKIHIKPTSNQIQEAMNQLKIFSKQKEKLYYFALTAWLSCFKAT
uniref:Uncharacterized protein n=1 Tax=Glossina austeni TaxID=7395 RepID=A0A1A9UGN9_GLOAU